MSGLGDIAKGLVGFVGDAPLAHIQAELAALAGQVGDLAQELERTKDSVHWEGGAADAFHRHADQRVQDLRALVRELDAAAGAAGGVVVAGGLL
ncbi:hypothetical protein CFP65_6500 [Kitasatospora sp. MMS16-BH015]|uniref:hypothetical protein n=1 Tax=Kitasatospora sp. MMS16-BH015 TaxID=2018025 RepID=UPI000CA3E67C|nr:hypothetical protein [Kitasatospora sp. MMS16-BH015]AUG81154.1 hypothetical protein CFP65_6500 [Kitasatospora sp. MMS16-BH015]